MLLPDEKLQIHPLVQARWVDGHIVLSRQDLPFEFPVADHRGIQLLHQFSVPVLPADVLSNVGGAHQAVVFITNLKNHKILVSVDEAEGRILPFDIQAVDDGAFDEIYTKSKNYNMGDVYMNFALFQAVKYIASAGIAGDLVETGVWKGGSSMMIALTLQKYGITDRKIYLYDSFDFTFPGYTEHDTTIYGRDNEQTGELVGKLQQKADQADKGQSEPVMSLDEVRKNVFSTGYPEENFVFVKGYVQDTIPAQIPERIALLRLDTDFYESTLHELRNLYTLVEKGGVLLIDDYPTEVGATRATDQYFSESEEDILLHRIGVQGRIGIRA
jgi:hypothetical protein